MADFLKLYLIVTGSLAFLTLTMPSLVILGLYLLIVPGLILSLAPTAFLWGLIFALFWWPLSLLMGDTLAIAPALAATAALLWFVPTPRYAQGKAMLARSILPDVTPATRFTPSGHIRIESGRPRWDKKNRAQQADVRWYACDNVCLALLLEPGVESVTVGNSSGLSLDQIREGAHNHNQSDRTYRLVPKADCPAETIVPSFDRKGLLGQTIEENEAIAAEWALKLANDVCIVGEPARAGWDMLLRWGSWSDPPSSARPRRWKWAFANPSANADYVEIRSRDAGVLVREWNVRVSALARPLTIGWSGTHSSADFHWGRTQFTSGKRYSQTAEIIHALRDHSTMRTTADRSTLAEDLSANLAAALADPAIAANAPVWASIPAWFTALADSGASYADRALAAALIRDTRLIWYDNIHKLPAAFADHEGELRAAIVARLLIEPDDITSKGFPHGALLFNLPPVSFATLTPDERALLADPVRRTRATGLIARLGDRGAASAPDLAELIRHHGAQLRALFATDANRAIPNSQRENATRRSARLEAHEAVIAAARIALCRMGPEAAAVLPQLRTAETDGTIRPHHLHDWHRMLARVGAPIDSIAKPPNLSGTNATYHRNLRYWLDRFTVERSCGRP